MQGDGANAVPHYQKLHTRLIHIWDSRRGQPNRSAMEGPRPGGTALVTTVSPVPGKYELFSRSIQHLCQSTVRAGVDRWQQFSTSDQSKTSSRSLYLNTYSNCASIKAPISFLQKKLYFLHQYPFVFFLFSSLRKGELQVAQSSKTGVNEECFN